MKFRNKKSGDVYVFAGFCVHSETLEPMIKYYNPSKVNIVEFVRPAELFFQKFEPVLG